ncbi:MAG TPA: RtcB family protein [Tepidisphaeraceae bacterium]
MKKTRSANVKMWLAEPLARDVRLAIERLARADDVQHIAVMPDVHLAREVCVGTVVATNHLVYPAAVGSDIGCGIAVVGFEAQADALRNPRVAQDLLEKLRGAVPAYRHHHGSLPEALTSRSLSNDRLEIIRRRDGSVQFGTLGRGNHFLEFQHDDEDRLWLMVHSGSRAIGQAVRDFHEAQVVGSKNSLRFLDAQSEAGAAYLADADWARAYAKASRRAMIDASVELSRNLIGAKADWASYFDCDHNHVRRETHFGREMWVHRKGAMSAQEGESGAIPGSMGTESFHVTGRGNAESLRSTSHGAGRAMSRMEACRKINTGDVRNALQRVHFDPRIIRSLPEESPAAYKDVRAVLRAEAELTRVVRRLRPVLVYKGR